MLPIPAHLFDNLISAKLLTTYNAQPPVPSLWPEYTSPTTGVWQYFGLPTWTSGFFPATFYALHERSILCPRLGLDEKAWLSRGRASSTGELPLLNRSGLDHDVGFMSYPFMDEIRMNPANKTAAQAVIGLGADLASLFNPVVGCTRSWINKPGVDPTVFQVIIDNMMNLELLFAAEALTGNRTLRDIAVSHADTTIKHHFRDDGSTFHLVEYNSTNGAVIERVTSQGYADWSAWSRGQSWAIFGYANMFKHTGFQRYLDTARHASSYWIANTPATGIIPWDFNAPSGPYIADTSAAMIAANGFLLLAQGEHAVGNVTGAAFYQRYAMNLVNTHSTAFWRPQWQSLLSNGTVNAPANNNLTGIVYGDYFFVRAGNEMVKQGLVSC
ncbi:d-4,5 unsaturated-glucuronyl hydrolase-like protein [Vararia minispora EC-137]|uniref:D-4,5 unsaturated-glucuronyl hydrolase-like protein n=1 Tax=Vararia minispora EC-137 TaxID=1314806 RepID=A0ACB8QT17_9AGAM|nr:d-4,5 unsaturated-glucuronyl hydrolase-like protein [Vararia minispora EC-137]